MIGDLRTWFDERKADLRGLGLTADLKDSPPESAKAVSVTDPRHPTADRPGGARLWHPDGAATPLRFPGQYNDPETGLHYNHHRYYDPVTGRYLTPDP